MSPITTVWKATLQQIAEAYFDALRDGNLARVPWAEDGRRSSTAFSAEPSQRPIRRRGTPATALTEVASLKMIRHDILGSAPDPQLPLDLRGRDGARCCSDAGPVAQTKTFLVLRDSYASGASVLDTFLARLAETINFVHKNRTAVHYQAAPPRRVGTLDADHWLVLMAAHTDRHMEQIRDAVKQGHTFAGAGPHHPIIRPRRSPRVNSRYLQNRVHFALDSNHCPDRHCGHQRQSILNCARGRHNGYGIEEFNW
jgi:hypothetical protein